MTLTSGTQDPSLLEDYGNWVRIVGLLTASPSSAREYRRTRAAVSSVIATNICNAAGLLTPARAGGIVTLTPVIYGIWLDNHSSAFPIYIGQTMNAERRLWDLPLGESHHLANTYPPEIWQRVVVIRWHDYLTNERASGRSSLTDVHDTSTIGLGLEYSFQTKFRPPMNLWSKDRTGTLREGRPETSQSIGKKVADLPGFSSFYESVEHVWLSLASAPVDLPGYVQFGVGGVAFPSFTFRHLVETG